MFNQTILIGNLGNDPELSYHGKKDQQGNLIEGTEYARTTFSLATNRVWTDASGVKMQKTVWFRVTCWRRTAETVAQYLEKGRQVLVVGEMEEASAWMDQEANLRATNEITARTVKFLAGGRQSAEEAAAIVEAASEEMVDEAPVAVAQPQPQPAPAAPKQPVANGQGTGKPQQIRTSNPRPILPRGQQPQAVPVAVAAELEDIPF